MIFLPSSFCETADEMKGFLLSEMASHNFDEDGVSPERATLKTCEDGENSSDTNMGDEVRIDDAPQSKEESSMGEILEKKLNNEPYKSETTPVNSGDESNVEKPPSPPRKKAKKMNNPKATPKVFNYPTGKQGNCKENATPVNKVVQSRVMTPKRPPRFKSKSKRQPLRETTRDRLLAWIDLYCSCEYGIWIQCSNSNCRKWRWVKEYQEAHEVPLTWFCNMNKDPLKNSCLAAESKLDDDEYSHAEFVPGSIVWAQLTGYPWWPAMVEDDPDLEEYLWLNEETDEVEEYHVTFLDKHVTRSWIPVSKVRRFIRKEKLPKTCAKNPTTRMAVEAAQERAMEALDMNLQERLKKFSFAFNYRGKWPPVQEDSDDILEKSSLDEALNDTRNLLKDVEDLDSLQSEDSVTAKDKTIEDALNETHELLKKVEDLDSLSSDDIGPTEKFMNTSKDLFNKSISDYESFQKSLPSSNKLDNYTSTQKSQNGQNIDEPKKKMAKKDTAVKKEKKQNLKKTKKSDAPRKVNKGPEQSMGSTRQQFPALINDNVLSKQGLDKRVRMGKQVVNKPADNTQKPEVKENVRFNPGNRLSKSNRNLSTSFRSNSLSNQEDCRYDSYILNMASSSAKEGPENVSRDGTAFSKLVPDDKDTANQFSFNGNIRKTAKLYNKAGDNPVENDTKSEDLALKAIATENIVMKEYKIDTYNSTLYDDSSIDLSNFVKSLNNFEHHDKLDEVKTDLPKIEVSEVINEALWADKNLSMNTMGACLKNIESVQHSIDDNGEMIFKDEKKPDISKTCPIKVPSVNYLATENSTSLDKEPIINSDGAKSFNYPKPRIGSESSTAIGGMSTTKKTKKKKADANNADKKTPQKRGPKKKTLQAMTNGFEGVPSATDVSQPTKVLKKKKLAQQEATAPDGKIQKPKAPKKKNHPAEKKQDPKENHPTIMAVQKPTASKFKMPLKEAMDNMKNEPVKDNVVFGKFLANGITEKNDYPVKRPDGSTIMTTQKPKGKFFQPPAVKNKTTPAPMQNNSPDSTTLAALDNSESGTSSQISEFLVQPRLQVSPKEDMKNEFLLKAVDKIWDDEDSNPFEVEE